MESNFKKIELYMDEFFVLSEIRDSHKLMLTLQFYLKFIIS